MNRSVRLAFSAVCGLGAVLLTARWLGSPHGIIVFRGLVLLFAILATVPCLDWHFSLRSLLIAMTLFALVLCMGMWLEDLLFCVVH